MLNTKATTLPQLPREAPPCLPRPEPPPTKGHAICSRPTATALCPTAAPTAAPGICAQLTAIRRATTPQPAPSRYTTPRMRRSAATGNCNCSQNHHYNTRVELVCGWFRKRLVNLDGVPFGLRLRPLGRIDFGLALGCEDHAAVTPAAIFLSGYFHSSLFKTVRSASLGPRFVHAIRGLFC
jgi:hypothetical protein